MNEPKTAQFAALLIGFLGMANFEEIVHSSSPLDFEEKIIHSFLQVFYNYVVHSLRHFLYGEIMCIYNKI